MSVRRSYDELSFPRTFVLIVFLTVLAPAAARADGLIVPFVGANFGGDSGKELGDAIDASRFNYGVGFVFMGGGVFGVEGDISYSPDFFGKADRGGSSVLSAMGNLVLGIPFGGQQGFGVRPYAIAGVGVIHTSGDAFEERLSFSDYKVSWDFGGGVMLFFATHVGIRADLRYIRTFEAVDFLGIDPLEQSGDLDFGRGSLGIIVRF